MKEFKNYLQTQLSIKKLKLQSIIREQESLPAPDNIDITQYGTKEELREMYNKDLQPNIIKRFFGPSKLDLQIHIKNKEELRLYSQKSKLEREISQIKQALEATTEQGIGLVSLY